MENTGKIETRIEEVLDGINRYGDLVGRQFDISPILYHVIEGLAVGIPSVLVLLAAPEIAAVGLAVEGAGEMGLVSGAFSTIAYISAAMGSAGSVVELTLAGLEVNHSLSPEQLKSFSAVRDLSDPIVLIYSSSALVANQLTSDMAFNSSSDIMGSFESSIFTGKVLSLMEELGNLGNVQRLGKSIISDSFQTIVQTATLGNSPSHGEGTVDKVRTMLDNAGRDSGLVPDDSIRPVFIHTPQYSNLFSRDGLESGLGIGTINFGNNKSSIDPDKNEIFWEHAQNDNFKQMQNSCRQFGSGEFFDPVPPANFEKPGSKEKRPNNQPTESTIPPEMGGTEDSGQGILL